MTTHFSASSTENPNSSGSDTRTLAASRAPLHMFNESFQNVILVDILGLLLVN
jgi:hypothetical protein